jgi:hypothetical protein
MFGSKCLFFVFLGGTQEALDHMASLLSRRFGLPIQRVMSRRLFKHCGKDYNSWKPKCLWILDVNGILWMGIFFGSKTLLIDRIGLQRDETSALHIQNID